jgi:hypothetical protein
VAAGLSRLLQLLLELGARLHLGGDHLTADTNSSRRCSSGCRQTAAARTVNGACGIEL